MNNPASNRTYKPPQALAPTPQLFDELVGDGMENLAKATVVEMLPLESGSVVLDVGCGTGAGTAATVAGTGDVAGVTVKGVDVNEDALKVYGEKVAEHNWPAQALHADAQNLSSFPDATFSHAIGTALLFVLPSDGVPALKEIYRTLRPGGIAVFNSWAYVPTMQPIRIAAQRTRPEGKQLPRSGTDKWEGPAFLKRVIVEGGFSEDKIRLAKRDVYATTSHLDRYAEMLWSFIGGTSEAGWLEEDEERWPEAIEIIKEELRKSDGCEELDGERLRLKFIANVAVAMK